MSPFSQNHSTGSFASSVPARPSVPSSELSPAQIADWRLQINACRHPVIILNSSFQPMLLNDALRRRMSDPDPVEGTDQPAVFVWQAICDTVRRLVAEHAAAGRSSQICEAFPLHQRCFVAVGTVLRNSAGYVQGAVINLGDLTSSKTRLQSVLGSGQTVPPAGAEAPEDEERSRFQDWVTQREAARQKMSRLSRRESQVVSLVSDGLPNKSIAHELDISVKTIEKHRANATRKLGVGSTAEMVRIAVVADSKSASVDRSAPDFPPGQNGPIAS
ncbi:MAG: LuxR C-terminal-related transcriptional regulator [Fuerstiella sp.]